MRKKWLVVCIDGKTEEVSFDDYVSRDGCLFLQIKRVQPELSSTAYTFDTILIVSLNNLLYVKPILEQVI